MPKAMRIALGHLAELAMMAEQGAEFSRSQGLATRAAFQRDE